MREQCDFSGLIQVLFGKYDVFVLHVGRSDIFYSFEDIEVACR